MSRLKVIAGGSPTRAQAAAILSAIETALADERGARLETIPEAYRSNWRRAGIESARRRGTKRATTWGRR
ncbi:MAG: hypothetical protein OEM67_02485 [Thermoleophilia bacterium]|nr:hypothetical protein [Thermoleophilia bacterium]MDH3724802.1 hypothetical protein [Thermoleophilia bacterium]